MGVSIREEERLHGNGRRALHSARMTMRRKDNELRRMNNSPAPGEETIVIFQLEVLRVLQSVLIVILNFGRAF